jgi:nucleobase:cation symporter-1, NCS1 family
MHWVFLVKSVCAIAAAFAMFGWAVRSGGTGPIFNQASAVQGTAKSLACLAAVNVAISGKTTLAINMPDLTRYAKSPSAAYWQMLYVPVVY